jgi:hypothetical protein
LLPKLRELKWTFDGRIKTLFPLFLSPDLEVLEMLQHGDDRRLFHGSVCHALTTCQHLQSLTLFHYNYEECTEAATTLIEWLSSAQMVEKLDLSIPEYLCPSAIKLILSLPRLGRLTLKCSVSASILAPEPFDVPQFMSLRHLELAASFSTALELARLNLSLSTLTFRCSGKTTATAARQWLGDTSGCYRRSLCEFQFGVMMDEAWDGIGLTAFVSRLPLTKLKLIIGPRLYISDQTLEELRASTPSLEELEVLPFDDMDRKVTIWGIFAFLRRCPKMRSLAIQFNAVVTEDAIGTRHLPESALVKLDVGSSFVTNPIVVAELLSEALPHLQEMTWEEEDKEYDSWEESDEIKWTYVWGLQQSYRRVRERCARKVLANSKNRLTEFIMCY